MAAHGPGELGLGAVEHRRLAVGHDRRLGLHVIDPADDFIGSDPIVVQIVRQGSVAEHHRIGDFGNGLALIIDPGSEILDIQSAVEENIGFGDIRSYRKLNKFIRDHGHARGDEFCSVDPRADDADTILDASGHGNVGIAVRDHRRFAAVDGDAVAGPVRAVEAQTSEDGIRVCKFDLELGAAPADIHSAFEAVRLTGGVLAVAVHVHERFEPVLAFAEMTPRGIERGIDFGVREIERLRIAGGRLLAGPVDADVGTREFGALALCPPFGPLQPGFFAVVIIAPLKLGKIKRDLSGLVIDLTDHLTHGGGIHIGVDDYQVAVNRIASANLIDNSLEPCRIAGLPDFRSHHAEGVFFVEQRLGLPGEILEVDAQRTDDDGTGTEVQLDDRTGVHAELLLTDVTGSARVFSLTGTVAGGSVARGIFATARPDKSGDVPHRVGHGGVALLRERLDHHRVDRRVLRTLVGAGELDDRNRVVAHRRLVDAEVRNTVGRSSGTAFGEVAPAVTVTVGMGVVNAGTCIFDVIARFPPVFHEVMVGEKFAEVQRTDLAEVVETVAVAAGHSRIERREPEHLGNEILCEICKSVVVGVVGDLRRGDAEHVLPPVGDSVAVDVGNLLELRFDDDTAVLKHHARGKIAPIGVARGHLAPVPDDDRIPLDLARVLVPDVRIIFFDGYLLPPFGDAVERRAHARVLPRRGRTVFVPHRFDILRESAAEGDHVVALPVEIATGKFEAGLVVDIETAVGPGVVSLRRGIAVKVRKARAGCGVCAEFTGGGDLHLVVDHLRPLRIRLGRLRERIGAELPALEVLRPVEGVERGAVEARQVGDGIVDPVHPDIALREIAAVGAAVRFKNLREPADPPIVGTRKRGLGGIAVGETVGRAPEILGIVGHRAEERIEVVVETKLGSGRVARHIAAVAFLPLVVDCLAVGGGIRGGEADLHRLGDLFARARAVPDADFVDPALEELFVCRKILLADGRFGGKRQRAAVIAVLADACADGDGDKLVIANTPELRDVVEIERRCAVFRINARKRVGYLHAVDVQLKRLAVIGGRKVRPVAGRGDALGFNDGTGESAG